MDRTSVPLSPERHRALRFEPNRLYGHAASLMVCPLVSGEIRDAARAYVVLFPKTEGLPLALLGTEAGKNAHVDNAGRWLGGYVPAYVLTYPFRLAEVSRDAAADKASFAIVIDEAAPNLSTSRGEPLFTQEGAPSPALTRMRQALANLQRDAEATARMVAELDRLGLLVERSLVVRRRGEAERGLTGFRVLDGDRLMAVGPDDLVQLQRCGALLLAYAHLVSLANLRDGLVVRRPGQPIEEEPSAFSFGQDAGFRFNA